MVPKAILLYKKIDASENVVDSENPKIQIPSQNIGFGAKALKMYLFSSKTCSISWFACSVNSEWEILKMNFSRLPLHQHFSAAANLLKIKGFGAPAPTELFCIFGKNELFKMWLTQYCFKRNGQDQSVSGWFWYDFDTILLGFEGFPKCV